MARNLQEELKIFHNIDRLAYACLVFDLHLSPKIGSEIVAFWNWLERIGYVNFVKNSLDLPPPLFLELSQESEACLDFLKRESFSVDDEKLLPQICSLAGKTLSFGVVYANKVHAERHMKVFKWNVCKRIFDDITPGTRSSGNGVNGAIPNGEIVRVQDNTGSNYLPQMVFDQLWEDNGNHSHSVVNESQPRQDQQANNGSHNFDNKTLFVTFSKGHPITHQELEEFFTRRYGGDCIENIYMSELFARVVVTSPQYIKRILGETEIVQSNIHGKDVRIRRFIPRGPPPPPPPEIYG
ncbi:uncharacterized protein LOC116110023 [Pistacia vera]|uniref:uncharacterized protein LOC116110023 n=1 Tax=Pistacia vera TaxID=55513 RepID=UPI001262FF62|nr:uncharacterized protein LOC116110023 [Pistacia vera]